MARFTTLYSGSSGNCSVVEQDGHYLLVDVGGSCRATLGALAQAGLAPEGLRGVLVTHEHIDHVRGLQVFLKKTRAPLVATAATLDVLWGRDILPAHTPLVEAEQGEVELDGFLVRAFPTSHDAAGCCGFRVQTPAGSTMAIATDLGRMTADVFIHFEGTALVALEANYDRVMLQTGPYPASLKRRIASPKGHLSNDEAAATVAQLVAAGCRAVALCHLSEENNHPRQVRAAVQNALYEAGVSLPQQAVVQIARRHEVSDWMDF